MLHVDPNDDRRHLRAYVGRLVHFRHQGVTFTATVSELSEGGARLETPLPLPEGARVELSLPLDRWCSARHGCELAGSVVRSRGGEAGIAFGRLRPRELLLIRDFVWRSLS
jgi:hypothetical protein